jgi:hypothetical protein
MFVQKHLIKTCAFVGKKSEDVRFRGGFLRLVTVFILEKSSDFTFGLLTWEICVE